MHPPTSSTYAAGRPLPPSYADPRSFPAAGDIAGSGPGFAEFLRSSPPPPVADSGAGSKQARAQLERAPRPERERRAELANDGPPAPDRKRPPTAATPHRSEEVAGDDLSAPPVVAEAEPEAPDANNAAPSDPGDTSGTATTSSEETISKETIDTSLSMLLAVADVPLTITAERAAAVTMDEPAGDPLVSISSEVSSTTTGADVGGEMAAATAVPTVADAATPPAARVSVHAEPVSAMPLAAPAADIVQPDAVVPAAAASDATMSAQPERVAVNAADESVARQLPGGSVAAQASEPSVDNEAAANDGDGAMSVVAMPGRDADVGYGDGEDAAGSSGERSPGSGPGQASASVGHAATSGRFEIPRNDAEALRSPTAQLAAPLAHAAKAGIQRVEIALEPAALGRVDVRLDFAPDGRVSAFFVAENRQALDALRADAQTLARALTDAGVDAGGLGFGLRHREPGNDGGSFTPASGRSGSESGGGLPMAPDAAGNPHSPFRSSSSGRLDIRA